ncbi:hypothetical protein BU15DRAFT_85441 [Melanogaster broomeanus]|nr:hypothetical protein BU15DRAFT_85441 [Melanogaster broomeanus]
MKSLLQDVDISLMTHKHKRQDDPTTPPPRELEAFADDEGDIEYHDIEQEDYPFDGPARRREDRKSPAARFGSDGIGAVVLPPELQRTVTALIEEDGSEKGWATAYDVEYKNRRQSYRHFERDGTAFAAIVLPAHYSAIYAVLQHVKHRLGVSWNVERVIDWGCGTGSGLWAALNAFQKTSVTPGEGPLLANSGVVTYLGIDKREGLVAIGKQLLQGTKLGGLSATWQKSFHEDDSRDPAEGYSTLALSAFMLSALPTPFAKRKMVQEMWDSGAHTIILIDHNSLAGFENIAEARQHLLDIGCKEMEDPKTTDWPFRGSHVIAPRLQRPTFVRRTKHATEGHEDIGYSYVVVRRGQRPNSSVPGAHGLVGRIGGEILVRARAQRSSSPTPSSLHQTPATLASASASESNSPSSVGHSETGPTPETAPEIWESPSDLEEALRREAYGWPRLVFPPLKRNGHIVIDACTQEGKIMRLTIPRSQGKQAFYDARKSSWGDIFPHPSKNKPIERFQPRQADSESKSRGPDGAKGSDIGKRSKGRDKKTDKVHKKSYAAIEEMIRKTQKARWKASRRDVAREEDDEGPFDIGKACVAPPLLSASTDHQMPDDQKLAFRLYVPVPPPIIFANV